MLQLLKGESTRKRNKLENNWLGMNSMLKLKRENWKITL
jgi:hypothetical protein